MKMLRLVVVVVVVAAVGVVSWLLGTGRLASRAQQCLVQPIAPNQDFSEGRPGMVSLIPSAGQEQTCLRSLIIGGPSMNPSLPDSTIATFDTNKKILADLHRSDIVLFKFPNNKDVYMAKRLIGLPGDTIEVKSGVVLINGQIVDEPYLPVGITTSGEVSKQLGDDEYFVMGDNRPNSSDSRIWGAIGSDSISGKFVTVDVKFR